MTGVLSGVRVVELASWTYVPSAGAALADFQPDFRDKIVEMASPHLSK